MSATGAGSPRNCDEKKNWASRHCAFKMFSMLRKKQNDLYRYRVVQSKNEISLGADAPIFYRRPITQIAQFKI